MKLHRNKVTMEVVSYAVALFPIGAGIVALATTLIMRIIEHPIAGPLINTTLVFLEKTKTVWKPAIATAIAVIKPIVKAVILLVRTARDMVLFAKNFIVSSLSWVNASGYDVTDAAIKFAKSLYLLANTLAKVAYYISRGFSILIVSLEQGSTFLGEALTNPSTITWDAFKHNASSLAVSAVVLGFLVWSLLPKRAVVYEKRVKSAVARRRAFLHSEDA